VAGASALLDTDAAEKNQRLWIPAFAGMTPLIVTPANAGVQLCALDRRLSKNQTPWIPASAGMTKRETLCRPRVGGDPALCSTPIREKISKALDSRFRGNDTLDCHPRERGGPALYSRQTSQQKPNVLVSRLRGNDNDDFAPPAMTARWSLRDSGAHRPGAPPRRCAPLSSSWIQRLRKNYFLFAMACSAFLTSSGPIVLAHLS
jgi:hypothetical protein